MRRGFFSPFDLLFLLDITKEEIARQTAEFHQTEMLATFLPMQLRLDSL